MKSKVKFSILKSVNTKSVCGIFKIAVLKVDTFPVYFQNNYYICLICVCVCVCMCLPLYMCLCVS